MRKLFIPLLLIGVLTMSGCGIKIGEFREEKITIKTEAYCEVSNPEDDEIWCTKGWKYTKQIPPQEFLQMLADQYIYEEGKTETTSTPAKLIKK